MTQTTNNSFQKPLINITLTAVSQTIILFFSIILSYILTLDTINLCINLLSCFIIFMLFDISYHRDKPKLLKWGFALTAVYYVTIALFTYKFFVSLFSAVIASSLIIGFSYDKHNEGNKRALIPSIVTVIQFFVIYNLAINYSNLLPHQLANNSIFEKHALLGLNLLLVASIFSNFIVLIWEKWWIATTIIVLGMVSASMYIFKGDEYITEERVLMVVLIYIFGTFITYFIDYLIAKSVIEEKVRQTYTPITERSMLYVVSISVIQTTILFMSCIYKSILVDIFDAIPAFIITLPYFFIFLLFNISCNKDRQLIIKWLLVLIAIIYLITILNYDVIGRYVYTLIITSSIMFALGYANIRGGGVKNYLWALTPSLLTAIQTITLYYTTNHYDALNSIFFHSWSLSTPKSIAMFIIISLTSNLIIMAYNRRWLLMTLTISTLGMVIYSICFLFSDNIDAQKMPLVITSIYAGGLIVAFLIKLLLAKSQPQILKE